MPNNLYPKPHTPYLAHAGFTLIELLVAMGLFLVVVIIASGTFVQALRTQRAAVELIAVNDNVNLSLEQITREIRVGNNFSRPSADSLQFVNAYGKNVIYRLNPDINVIEKSVDGGSFEAVTATNVAIRRLTFMVSGIGAGDSFQPRITIAVSVGGRTKFLEGTVTNLETTISPRILEN